MPIKQDKISPFSDNPIMIGYDNRIFDFDADLGYVFPSNQLIGKEGFVDLEKKIFDLKNSSQNFTILNVGDSSVSGWNSNKVFKGCPDPLSALFSYKTFSVFLEEKNINVINAGVPGYGSYQVKKYTERLLKKLAQSKIAVDYVSIYVGNNDCTFNGIEDKTRIDQKAPSENEIFTRVSKTDFAENLRDIAKVIKSYGAEPIFIVPASNYNWRPGIRSEKYPDELNQEIYLISNEPVKELLSDSQKAYGSGDLKLALEKDLLLPRIKEEYKNTIIEVSKEMDVSLIETQDLVVEKSFVDYCHPSETLNASIADRIHKILKKKNTAYPSKLPQDVTSDTYTLY